MNDRPNAREFDQTISSMRRSPARQIYVTSGLRPVFVWFSSKLSMPSSRLSELGQSSSRNGWNSEASVSVSTRCVVCTAQQRLPVDSQCEPL